MKKIIFQHLNITGFILASLIVIGLLGITPSHSHETMTTFYNKALTITSVSESFEGSLLDYEKKFMTLDGGKGLVPFRVNQENHFELSSAEAIARLVWKVWFPSAVSKDLVFPCGNYLAGRLKHSGTENGNLSSYSISIEGDGGGDSCLGTGGPGWASYKLNVTYDSERNSGTIQYSFYTE